VRLNLELLHLLLGLGCVVLVLGIRARGDVGFPMEYEILIELIQVQLKTLRRCLLARLAGDNQFLRVHARVAGFCFVSLLVDLSVDFSEFLAETRRGSVQVLVVVDLDLIALLGIQVVVLVLVLNSLVRVKVRIEVGSYGLAHYFSIVQGVVLVVRELRIIQDPATISLVVDDAARVEV